MGSFYRSQHELIFVFKDPRAPHTNNVELGKYGRNRTNVWAYPGGAAAMKKELALHSTPKPVALVADAIRDCTSRGDIVLDAFSGSGTTIIAAARTGRQARVIELDPRYVDVAVRRWEIWSGGTAYHVGTGLTFEELRQQRQTDTKPIAAAALPYRVRQRIRQV
jgi:DNA modification methylase